MASLADMRPGMRAQVLDVGGEESLAQRLLDMGLIEGASVEFLRAAPLGDPIEIRLDDRYNLSLRRVDAANVSVSITE
jgi:Fe2+ transport system protein FeoA